MRKPFWSAAALLAGVAGAFAATSPKGSIQTNWVERWVTNTVQVQMQANKFVTEYHTNWVQQVETNLVDVYSTNYVTKTLTNKLLVDFVQTNLVRA